MSSPLPPILEGALREYRALLEGALPGRIQRVVLFGSWARGEANEDSDVDVLVLVEGATSTERLRAVELGAAVGLDHGLVLEPVVLSVAQWHDLERRERALVEEVRRDGAEVRA